MKIEVGIMVQVVGQPKSQLGEKILGHVGRVLRPCNIYSGNWDIEGIEVSPIDGKPLSVPSKNLQPINPDHEPCEQEFADQLKTWLRGGVKA